MKKKQRIVIKLGSSLMQEMTKQGYEYLLHLAKQISQLQKVGVEVILVSSGAVLTGRELSHSSISNKQTLAAVGQAKLMQAWSELFSSCDVIIGQVLLTRNNFSDSERSNTRNILNDLLDQEILPILNENDTMATEENSIGNNDVLAALVANLIDANKLILLTDQEGFYTTDPRLDPDAKLISDVQNIDGTIFAFASDTSSGFGTGGMVTKIKAAELALQSKIPTIIASSRRKNILIDLMHGKKLGTFIH